MAVWGLDVQQVRELGMHLKRDSDAIRQIMSTLTSKLQSVQWTGPDAEQFRNEWSGTHVPALNRVIEALANAGEKATKNASEQENVSSH